MQFTNSAINLPALRTRAYNLRWATLPADVIPLTAADPDFRCAPEIVTAINEYAAERTFSYGPAEGLPAFREVIAQTMRTKRNIKTQESLILPVDSAAQGMYITAAYCLKPGDKAIIFDPVDFLFKKSVEAAGATPVYFAIDVVTGTWDAALLESLIDPQTRMLCICNPLNPSGKVFTPQELEILGSIAIKHDLWIMSDEIWSDIVYAPAVYTSIASLRPEIARRTITVYGFSKSFGIAGLRAGFIIAPSPLVHEGLLEASQMRTTAYGTSTLSQMAAKAAYEHAYYWVDEFMEHLTRMRNMVVGRLNNMKNISCHMPDGCYLVFPNIARTGKTSEEMAAYLLEEARVAVVPGAEKWFGPGAEGHIRICISTSEEILTEAMNRIEAALAKL